MRPSVDSTMRKTRFGSEPEYGGVGGGAGGTGAVRDAEICGPVGLLARPASDVFR